MDQATDDTTYIEYKARHDSLKKTYNEFEQVAAELTELVDENDFALYLELFTEFEETYLILLSNILIKMQQHEQHQGQENELVLSRCQSQTLASSDSSEIQLESIKAQAAKLPQIQVPTFNGDPTQWLTFKDTYTAIIHNNNKISNIVKFIYLLDKLKGDARDTVGHITLTSAGYDKAWAEINQTYNNVRLIVEVHIEALCSLLQIKKDNAQDLRILSNACRNHISSLEACNLEVSGLGEQILIHIITKKFDVQLRKEWEDKLTQTDMPTWTQLKEFLQIKCRVLESVEQTKKQTDVFAPSAHKSNYKVQTNFNKNYRKCSTFVLSNSAKNENCQISNDKKYNNNKQNLCRICQATYHPLFVCQSFFKLSPNDRLQKAKELKVCINCFGSSHSIDHCKSSGCRVCHSKHHTMLHDSLGNKSVELHANNNQVFQNMHASTVSEVLLSTAIIHIQDKSGKYHDCRVLLDSGSQSNFIVSAFANKLGINSCTIPNLTIGGINKTKTIISNSISTNIKSKYNPYNKHLNFLIVPQISESLPQANLNISSWSIPSNLNLADPNFYISRPVEALLGAEIFFDVLKLNHIKLNNNIPILQESSFGWILGGRSITPVTTKQHNFYAQVESNLSDDLAQSIKMFWEIEKLPIKKILSDEEKQCEELFSKTHYRTVSGRYVVSLPIKPNMILGESKTIALKRFHYLENKLNSNSTLKQGYTEFINEYLNLGHMKETANFSHTSSNFLPHHAILKPNSSSTKLRVVFDASTKTSNQLSLNNILQIGPTVQQDLFSIVLRFRKYRFAFTADISKMYRQILINSDQTKLQTILWRSNTIDPIRAYELLTVTYGTASAPYLATRVLTQLANDERHNFPNAARVTKTDFYVDDILSGSDTLEEAIQIQTELIHMLKTGGFELHKWCANNEKLLERIPLENREKLKKNEENGSESIKTLGLIWRPDEDIFVFEMPSIAHHSILTKRIMLSEIAKLYDPLGLLGPIIIIAKLQIQMLWKSQTGWDEELPTNECITWNQFRSQLSMVNEIKLNRCVMPSTLIKTELHGFSDASEKAYGACVYIKTIDEQNNISIELLCSKSRVAPLKTLSMPRLELCGALLLSNLVKIVIEAMCINFNSVNLWSDSTITLYWIKTPPYKLKTFVANRVNEIQEQTSEYSWGHILSESNPADLLTRGLSPLELPITNLWWHGPEYLHETNKYPNANINDIIDTSQEFELKSIPPMNLIAINTLPFNLISKFSSFQKLVRVTSYCLRFINNIKKNKDKIFGPLTLLETERSIIQLCKISQFEFSTEINCLRQNKPIHKSNNLNQLNPFLDKDSLLRVGGRISKSLLSYDNKHQILLPNKCHLSLLIFRHEHQQNFHAGPQLLLSLVRQKYCVLHGKSIAKKVVRNCIACIKAKPVRLQQIMGDLPPERISPARPFNVTGVDFCGPFLIKNKYLRKSNASKVFVAVYVCFVTKAIHLDIISDLSSEAFISCLKRFISRRGKIKTLYSDNAKTFIGADNELRKRLTTFKDQLQDDTIFNFCNTEGIEWKFIPPRAPNFGGLWESAVKSFKGHLKRVTNGQYYTYEEFYTLIVQIESILNSRPLSIISSDPNDPLPLTPGHFLTGGSMKAILEPIIDNSQTVLSNWKKVTCAVQSFWKRYSLEYLHTLQNRTKWRNTNPDLKLGDVVLLIEDNPIVTNWVMGLVVSLHPGSDGKVRVVEVKTKMEFLNELYQKFVNFLNEM